MYFLILIYCLGPQHSYSSISFKITFPSAIPPSPFRPFITHVTLFSDRELASQRHKGKTWDHMGQRAGLHIHSHPHTMPSVHCLLCSCEYSSRQVGFLLPYERAAGRVNPERRVWEQPRPALPTFKINVNLSSPCSEVSNQTAP